MKNISILIVFSLFILGCKTVSSAESGSTLMSATEFINDTERSWYNRYANKLLAATPAQVQDLIFLQNMHQDAWNLEGYAKATLRHYDGSAGGCRSLNFVRKKLVDLGEELTKSLIDVPTPAEARRKANVLVWFGRQISAKIASITGTADRTDAAIVTREEEDLFFDLSSDLEATSSADVQNLNHLIGIHGDTWNRRGFAAAILRHNPTSSAAPIVGATFRTLNKTGALLKTYVIDPPRRGRARTAASEIQRHGTELKVTLERWDIDSWVVDTDPDCPYVDGRYYDTTYPSVTAIIGQTGCDLKIEHSNGVRTTASYDDRRGLFSGNGIYSASCSFRVEMKPFGRDDISWDVTWNRGCDRDGRTDRSSLRRR